MATRGKHLPGSVRMSCRRQEGWQRADHDVRDVQVFRHEAPLVIQLVVLVPQLLGIPIGMHRNTTLIV